MSPAKTHIVIAGQSRREAEAVAAIFEGVLGLEFEIRMMASAADNPLQGLSQFPDVMLYLLSADPKEADAELRLLANQPASLRPPTLVIGPKDSLSLMRRAMQAGARDFFVQPLVPTEILAAVRMIVKERAGHLGKGGRLSALINARGGSGASFLAVNLASLLVKPLGFKTVLMDFDFQFGCLAIDLDVEAKYSVREIIDHINELDAPALEAYMTKHPEGLHLLANPVHEFILPGEIQTSRLERLLQLSRQAYAEIVVDVPRYIDGVSSLVLADADEILMVMQQSVAHVRDCKRLINILRNELEIPPNRLRVVLNRFDARSPMTVEDIAETLRLERILAIPNDWTNASAAANLGKPISVYAPQSPVSRALEDFAREFTGMKRKGARRGFLGRLFAFAR
jgi:pilus assembly protein CpaE